MWFTPLRNTTLKATSVVLALCTPTASAEFYIWHDESGIKHISTHPRFCFEDGRIDQWKVGCAAWTISPEQRLLIEMDERRTAAMKKAETFETECAALKLKVEALSKGIAERQASFNTRVLMAATHGDPPPGLNEITTLPAKLSQMQEDMLLADKAYDQCVSEAEWPARKQARNQIRRQTAANARYAQQQNILYGIQSKLQSIKQDVERY